ncbi:MAG: FIVAR domain-containing protein, partial [[Clostridium] spiroforme]|nr:FIVAR domain-containing protein [Thomasclavelia spiroformis]
LNLASYSKATVQIVNDALENAKNVLANKNATQKEVDNAKATLEKAINSLEANVNTPADNTVSTPVNNGDTAVSVKTGDESSVGMFVTISLLTVAGYIVLTRKKD